MQVGSGHVTAGRRAFAARETVVGLALAAAIIAAWLAVHLLAVFILPAPVVLAAAPVLVALQCWLSVGLFTIAHDCMHGSLAPYRPRLNRAVGRLALMLYAGIWYDAIIARHYAHHRFPGSEADPDFDGDGSGPWWRWYGAFLLEYLTVRQIAWVVGLATLYAYGLSVPLPRLLLVWALPALLSSLQLFYFGTYLPHRREAEAFADGHRARSSDYSWLVSLLTCFHFGYHHEHHAEPTVPWWRLPAVRNGPQPVRAHD